MSVTEPDYVYEKRLPLDERIARLAEEAREARAEADHARQQPGLLGPAENARAAAERLEREAAELREVALRIDRGYPWWERDGFEIALDACALFSQWQPLSESVTREFVYGNDETDLRLPVPVQHAYGKALKSGFFSRFEVCATFDVEGDEVVAITYYLFGVQDRTSRASGRASSSSTRGAARRRGRMDRRKLLVNLGEVETALREYAESPDRFAHLPAEASVGRFADERICILQGPTWASVSGISVGEDEVQALLAEVREHVPAEKEPLWWIGPSTRPLGLYEQLHALGLAKPRDRASLLHALVLTHEPEAAPEEVEVCRIETYEQFRSARELQWEVFETPVDRRERERERLREDFEESQRFGIPVGFLGILDGRPAATALAVPSDRGLFLIGGSTARWARGRGLYRALVRARWDYAVQRGTPALVTHAVPDTSYPILRGLGFQDVCTIRRLEDARPVIAATPQRDHGS